MIRTSLIGHPKIDKKLLDQSQMIGLKNASKPFPSSKVGLFRWGVKSQDESLLPINITCWPEEDGDGKVVVSMEYDMSGLEKDMKLKNVDIMIPLGTPDIPHIESIDGEYHVDAQSQILIWHHAELDSTENSTGALEFSIRSNNPDGFFPVNVSFFSDSTTFTDIDVVAVNTVEDNAPVQFGLTKLLQTDRYMVQ